MSIFSRVSANLSAVKKLASIAHLGNGISIDAAKSLISKQLSAVTSGLTGATSGLTGAITTATKVAGVATTVAKITGGTLSSPVSPAPVVFSTPPIIKIESSKDQLVVVANNQDSLFFSWEIIGATSFSIVDSRPFITLLQTNPGWVGEGPFTPTLGGSDFKGAGFTITASNSRGTTVESRQWTLVQPDFALAPTPSPTVYTPTVAAGSGLKIVISGGKPGASYNSSFSQIKSGITITSSVSGTFDSSGNDIIGPFDPAEYIGTLTSNGVTVSYDITI